MRLAGTQEQYIGTMCCTIDPLAHHHRRRFWVTHRNIVDSQVLFSSAEHNYNYYCNSPTTVKQIQICPLLVTLITADIDKQPSLALLLLN